MKLYHGTSEAVARKALTEGLKPRRASRNTGNWKGTVVSNPNLIYLTVAYAPYFAMCASGEGGWGIVELDTDFLEEDNLLPDEDFLEQASRNQTLPEEWGINNVSMEKRTRFFRDNLSLFQHLWVRSLEGLGNASHRGKIPREAITRVVLFDPDLNKKMMFMAADPSISLLNFAVAQDKYKALTRWFAGYEIDPVELLLYRGMKVEQIPPEIREHFERESSSLKEMVGLERLL